MGNGRFNENQIKALEAEGSALVSASAGSGKTTVVIEKILRLILKGGDIRRMAVMTFSRAAAAEMKNRLVKGLYDAARSGNSSNAHVLKQLEAFPFANICTIDSFCYNLIKKYFATIGADPSATPLDPDESALIYDECIDRACEDRLENKDKDFIAYAERYTVARRLDSVKDQIKALKNFLKVQPDIEEFFAADHTEAVNGYFLNEFKLRARIVKDLCFDALPSLREAEMKEEESNALKIADSMEKLLVSSTCEGFFSITKFLCGVKSCLKRKEIYLNAKELFNAAVKEYNDFILQCAKFSAAYFDWRGNETCKKDAKALAEVTLSAEKLYSERKKRDGKLDFDDMGAMALKILKNDAIREEVRASFDYIFVDEYQDTNYLQENLLKGISDGGNIFAVGDVKQAIYHFRYAEPSIFQKRMESYDNFGGGRNILLNENYRSRKEILDFVNIVCAEVITSDFCDIDYRHGNMMKAGANYADENTAVEIFVCKKEETEEIPSGVYSVRDALCGNKSDVQAEFISLYIKKAIQNKETVFRPKTGNNKELSFGDIAVLCRRKKECAIVCESFKRHNIPYSVGDAEEGIYAPRELLVDFIRLCISSLDVPLINVLTSPNFGFTAEELMKIRKQSPKTSFWEALNSYNCDDETAKRAQRALAYIEKLRSDSVALSVSDIMTRVLSDGLDGYYVSLGGDVSAKIYKFLDSVKRMDCDGDAGDFLDFYDNSYKGEKPPSKADGVTVMTLHKSKGLEFPVVFIPFTDAKSVGLTVSRSSLYLDRELGIALKSINEEKGTSDNNFPTLVQKMKALKEERQELARLMYVGFTRAENRLILTAEQIKSRDLFSADCFADFIGYAAEKNSLVKSYIKEIEIEDDAFADKEETEDAKDADFSYIFEEYPYEKSTATPNKFSVSELLEKEVGTYSPFKKTELSGSAEEGTAYHLVLQRINFRNKPEEIEKLIESLKASGEISEETAKKLDVLKIMKLLESDCMRLAREGETEGTRESPVKIYREQPFMSCIKTDGGDSVLVQGVIDLLIEEPDGLTVVDYKASGADRENLVKRYVKQLEIYSDAAARIWGKPIKKRVLFNILRNYEVEI